MSNAWDDVLQRRHGDKVKPAPTATTGQPTETKDQIEARVRTEEAKRVNEITAACSLADCPERAADFIADRTKSLSDVLAALLRGKSRPKG